MASCGLACLPVTAENPGPMQTCWIIIYTLKYPRASEMVQQVKGKPLPPELSTPMKEEN